MNALLSRLNCFFQRVHFLPRARREVRRELRIPLPPRKRSDFIDPTRSASDDYMRAIGIGKR